RRRVLMAAALAVAATILTLAPGDAGAWTDGACTTPSGVTVVVDFQELGGGVHVRCAPQPATNGFEALRQAGIDFSTTVRFPGFLCRIAGEPSSDPCQTTSPATAYWSYWIAQRGGPWCYSNLGAGNRTPPPGSVEGWSFSLGRTSSTAPAPRTRVPVPLPGTAPTPLSTGDCDRRVDAPAPRPPTPTTPSPTPPPAIGPSGAAPHGGAIDAPSPGSSPPAGAPAGAPVDAGDGVDGPGDAEDPAVGLASGAADPPTSATADEDTDGHARSADDDPVGDGVDGDEADDGVALRGEQSAAVDLGGDPDRSSSPVGVVVAAVLMAALTGGALVVRRRSRVAHAA
ncbi:MAG: hypothetical protein ACK4V6_19185, partial [Microthrixaceae bacterium]